MACQDLQAHHGEQQGSGRVNNACPRCRWFLPEISQWPRWDGTLPDRVDATTSDSSRVTALDPRYRDRLVGGGGGAADLDADHKYAQQLGQEWHIEDTDLVAEDTALQQELVEQPTAEGGAAAAPPMASEGSERGAAEEPEPGPYDPYDPCAHCLERREAQGQLQDRQHFRGPLQED
mmetsp:Transcript_7473/g.15658  ORF Transcript_7473/g.15658 Transcript_7473/m.15658 type:complete len:177 (+) Transcript_7473:1181-1711(+)